MRTLVMGGTRFLGLEVVDLLLRAGHEVTVFHRGTRAPQWSQPVTHVIGDRTVPADLARLRDLPVDAVLDLSAYTRSHTELLLDVLPDVATFVHVSTVNVYRPSPLLPWPEDLPYGPHPLWGEYAVEKIGCELALRERRPAGTGTVAVRFPLILGPGNYIPREEFVLNRLLDGETLLLPGDGQAVHQYVWLRHAARALVRALDLTAEGFEAFNVASRRCITSLQGFVEICAEVSGTTPRVRTVGGGPTGADLPVFNGVNCVFPFSNENTFADLSKADAAGLIAEFVPLQVMIAEALAHLLGRPGGRAWTRTPAEQQVLLQLQINSRSR